MTDSNQWIDLCPLAEVPQHGGKYVTVGNRALAVFRDGDAARVMDDACPHAGGSLSAGSLRDGCVVCPWHAWEFELETGECPDNRDIAARVYESRVVDDRVQVRLSS